MNVTNPTATHTVTLNVYEDYGRRELEYTWDREWLTRGGDQIKQGRKVTIPCFANIPQTLEQVLAENKRDQAAGQRLIRKYKERKARNQ